MMKMTKIVIRDIARSFCFSVAVSIFFFHLVFLIADFSALITLKADGPIGGSIDGSVSFVEIRRSGATNAAKADAL